MMRHSAFVSGPSARTIRETLAIVVTTFLSLLIPAGCGSGGGQMQPPSPSQQFTNIDAPGAGQTTPEGTFGIGTDANGDVVGYTIDSNQVLHGFLRLSSGSITTVDVPGAGTQQGLGTALISINSTGETVGFFYDTQGAEHSFIRSSTGTITVFDPPGASGSGAGCINDDGTVAGGFVDASGAHGFVRTADGTITTFDPTGDPTQVRIVIPNQINANGLVAGDYVDPNRAFHGFFVDSSGAVTLFDASGAGTATGTGTQPFDMNGTGAIVGEVTTGFSNGLAVSHSFMRAADGTITEFDPPTAGPNGSLADGINDSGEIVGSYTDANLVRHGYLRKADGTFVTLDDPKAAQLPSSLTNLDTIPRRINASGAVVGLFSDSAGVRHAFIWQ